MTLNHPTIPGVSVDVPEADAPDWLAAGWLAEPAPTPATSDEGKASNPKEPTK